MKTALVLGATGLVGGHLVRQLLEDPRFERVVAFVRRPTGLTHNKLEEHEVDFDQPSTWHDLIRGDVLFSALGTTRKKAGGKTHQFRVDFTYQYRFAAAAARHAVPVMVLVSASGAYSESRFFYMRMKGALENEIKGLLFKRLVLIRPGLLQGEREGKRIGENLAGSFLDGINRLGLLRKYRPIGGDVVARAMINSYFDEREGVVSYDMDQLFSLAENDALKKVSKSKTI